MFVYASWGVNRIYKEEYTFKRLYLKRIIYLDRENDIIGWNETFVKVFELYNAPSL